MLFLRGFGHHLAIVLIIHVYFVTTEDCEAEFRQVLVKRERGRPCVYVYQQSGAVRFIGWRFSLNQGQQAIAAFERLGVDYEQFKKSPATPSDDSCECSRVPCLNKRQMNKLLDLSVNKTLQTILAIVPSFTNLCCSLQRCILILAFTSGGRILSDFASSDIEYHIKMQNWQVLSHGLNQTEWCRNNQEVCAEQTRAVADGCVDLGVSDVKRDQRGIHDDSKDSATCAENTCREGSTVVLPTRVHVSPVDIRSTAMMNSLIFVKLSTYAPKDKIHMSRHIPVGTTFVAPITDVGDFERNSQFASKPYVEISGMRKKPLFSTDSSLFTINFLAPVSSSAKKSPEKDAPFRLSLVESTTGNGQGYFYSTYTESANISPTHGTSEYRDGKTSGAWSFSLTSSLKFVAQTAKPSSVILSNSLRNISRTGWSSSPPEAESVSLRRLSFETSPSQVLQTNTPLNVAKLSSPTTPAMVHKDWSFSVTPSVKFATAEKARPASVIQNKPLKIPRTWSSSSLEAKPRVSLKSSWQLQKTSFRRTSYILNAMVTTGSLLGLTESILSTVPASETPNNAELPFETSSNKVLHTKTSLKFALTPSVTFESEIAKPSSVIVNNALRISKTWSTPLSTEAGERVSFTSSWPLQQISLYRTSFVLETGMPSSSLGHKSLFSATSTSKTTVCPDLSFETSSSLGLKYLVSTTSASKRYNGPGLSFETSSSLGLKYLVSATSASKTYNGPDLSFETSSSLGLKYLVSATSASKTYNGPDLSLETSLSQVLQSSMSLRFAVLNSSTTHHKRDLSPKITSTPRLTSKAMLSQLSSSMSKTWFAHVQQKSEHIGASRTWLSKIDVTEISIRPTYQSTSPSSLSSRVILNFSRSSEILAQSLSSATQNISSKLTVQASDHLDPAILPGTTRSFRNSAGFSSTIQGIVSIRISQTLSKRSRSFNPSIRSSSHSSVRAALFTEGKTAVNISSFSSTHVGVSSLLFLHTHSAVLSTAILDMKSIALLTLLPWMTPQTGNTVSNISDMRTINVSLPIRTPNVITWTSSLSPSTIRPTPLHSPRSTTTTITTTNAITTSPDDKTLSAISLSVSAKKLSSSATIGVVSTKMGRIHRNSSAASSLGSATLHLQRTSLQRKSSALDHKTTTLQPSAERKSGTPLPSSHGLVSTASVTFPKSLGAHCTTLVPSLIRRTVISPSFASSELSALSSVPGFSRYDQAFLVIFSGNCAMLDNKDVFAEQFKAVLSKLLAIHMADISIRRISCGSVHVLFSIRGAKGRNIINKLTGIVQDEGFKFEYNNMIFVALDVSEVLKLPTTVRPSRTTHTPRTTEAKQIAFIIFLFVVSFFAALAVFLAAVFCARFCRCCQRHQTQRQNPKQTPAEVELKVFSSLYLNLFRKVDYYGGSQREVTPGKGRKEECEHEDNDMQPVSTVTALLSENRNVTYLEEKQLNFDDKDSCSSVLFY